jgi:putative hydrolase of the HAD superfamily
MKKVILYDLDHTLFDSTTLDRAIFQPAFDTLLESELITENSFNELKNDFFSISLNTFIEKHLNEQTKKRFIQSLRDIHSLPKLKTYSDGYVVPQIGTVNYLVTSGLKEFQNQKIDALGIRHWFTEVYIDDPIAPKWKDKEEIMRLIINKHHYNISELLVVGDNPESEIKAGNNIGIETVQILREGIEASETANYRIKSLHELNKYVLQ